MTTQINDLKASVASKDEQILKLDEQLEQINQELILKTVQNKKLNDNTKFLKNENLTLADQK